MNKIKQKKIIGILGGMGPQASSRLVQILVDLSAKEFGAKNGDEFPEIVLDSIPVPDFIANKKNKKAALEMLKQRVKQMDTMQVGIFAIACNTAHVLLNQLQAVSKAPFVSMVEEVAKEVKRQGVKKVGLLASPTTFKSGIFQKDFKSIIQPSKKEQVILEKIIRKVIAGEIKKSDKLKLVEIARSLKKKGAQGIILGCTELSLIFPKKFEIPVFDSLEILARALLDRL
ncbi:amino acid racemase [Patescibacteria group bacterium]|nr:amino acid racemase [Patescibacteria group bacterium]